MKQRHCYLILTADKGYDDTKLIVKLWDEHQIKPVIDIRDMWKDGEKTRLLTGKDNIVYDYKGTVYCYCPETNNRVTRWPLEDLKRTVKLAKYRCPAGHYGLECKGMNQCKFFLFHSY